MLEQNVVADATHRLKTASAVGNGLRRHPFLLVHTLMLVGLGVAVYVRLSVPAFASTPAPADLFMQSVATEDGALGWQQLCPALQSQLPRDVLEQQTAMQRAASAQQGLTLTVEHLGDRPRPAGGQVRTYLATAKSADGSVGQKTYVVTTESSGCVESVQ
jgi:hypothetical protein